MTYTLPVTEARRDLLNLVDMVDEQYARIDLTKRGKIKATLVSPEYLESMEETIYTLTHSMKDIKRAEKAVARGEYVTLEEFKKNLERRLKRDAR
jgi:prevent-host-death family protein